MKTFTALLLFCIILSCNPEFDHVVIPPVAEEVLDVETNAHAPLKEDYNAQLASWDSMMNSDPELKTLHQYFDFSPSAAKSFSTIANESGGSLIKIVSARELNDAIKKIIQKHGEDRADLMFLIDVTGSMLDDYAQLKAGLADIIAEISKFKKLRLSIATYGDHHVDSVWFQFNNFETDYSGAESFINKIKMAGGGDEPESVYEGYFAACKEFNWKSENKRMVIIIGDAPPLEAPLSKFTMEKMVAHAKREKVHTNFYPILVSPGENDMPGSYKVPFDKVPLIDQLFPNPTKGPLKLRMYNESTYQYIVYTIKGEEVFSGTFRGKEEELNLQELPDGAYLIRIRDDQFRVDQKKFIVAK